MQNILFNIPYLNISFIGCLYNQADMHGSLDSFSAVCLSIFLSVCLSHFVFGPLRRPYVFLGTLLLVASHWLAAWYAGWLGDGGDVQGWMLHVLTEGQMGVYMNRSMSVVVRLVVKMMMTVMMMMLLLLLVLVLIDVQVKKMLH